jgi:hypothetical protein
VKLSEQETKIDCFIKHLKVQGKLNSSFPNYSKESESSTNDNLFCDSALDSIKMRSLRRLNDTMRHLNEKDIKCTQNDINLNNLYDSAMLEEVYEGQGLILEAERTQKLKDLNLKFDHVIYKSMFKCMSEASIGAAFDRSMEKSPFYYEEENYCERKLVVDNNLTIFNVTLNPKNSVNCEEIIKNWIDEMDKAARRFGEAVRECMLETDRETGFTLRQVALNVLRTLDLTDEQRQIERANFIKHSEMFFKKMSTCMS